MSNTESAQRQCLQAAVAVCGAAVRCNLLAGQAQAVFHAQPVGLQHPGREARDAGLRVLQAGGSAVQPEFVVLRLLGVGVRFADAPAASTPAPPRRPYTLPLWQELEIGLPVSA